MAFTFVDPSTVKLDLGDGDWVEVKRELTAGELKAMRTAGFTHMSGTPDSERVGGDAEKNVTIGIDWRRLGISRLVAYVVDWNAKDAQGRPVPWSREAAEQLTASDFERLEAAINAHEKTIGATKNVQAGEKK